MNLQVFNKIVVVYTDLHSCVPFRIVNRPTRLTPAFGIWSVWSCGIDRRLSLSGVYNQQNPWDESNFALMRNIGCLNRLGWDPKSPLDGGFFLSGSRSETIQTTNEGRIMRPKSQPRIGSVEILPQLWLSISPVAIIGVPMLVAAWLVRRYIHTRH